MERHRTREELEARTAVLAHGLLTSMSVVSAGVRTIWEHWADLPLQERDHLFERILVHGDLVTDGLKDLAQGLPERHEAQSDSRPKPN